MPFIIACLIGAFVDLSGAGLPRSAAVIAAIVPTLPTMIWIAGA